MTNYTAEEFAAAKFAEHPTAGRMAMRFGWSLAPWLVELGSAPGAWLSDQNMSERGWVPVPSKPTITESEFDEIAGTSSPASREDFRRFLSRKNFTVVPDPEPTNAERLGAIIAEKFQLEYRGDPNDALGIGRYLDEAGVRAPGGGS